MVAGAKKGTTKRARPQRLAGMEDAGIPELDNLAMEYADVRDRRMALSREEKELKDRILTSMHKHKRNDYKYGSVTITIVPGDEDVKVKVKAEDVEIDED